MDTMKMIQPSGVHGVGRSILVDDADYENLAVHRWHIAGIRNNRPNETPKPYAGRCLWHEGKTKIQLMHRQILGAVSGQIIDHIDGNGLNNCRANIRFVTQSQNLANSKGRAHSSRFKGVFFQKDPRYHLSPWWARIKVRGRNIHIGVYRTELEAAQAYNALAAEHFGEYALLNVVG